ncbi:leucyl-tRNA--protein transferase [Knoellia flava TL1]|uniref:Leucyl/phenylalanyl-tRNA--protein transferase n=2 Tax=Knoellia flava TaxID=913969 RepID=A0A8H9KRS8_9MICO|nr:leucyl/phenylalanyl-tRNA--protein transferase [Knoellia flava]KGN31773.1 leucyl-tRNA--protein transferase [Knoellia flava TL1]GGB89268.1 leucyl/phenylalanyl-tRNA--protein transferase [Knoellia flava]
MTVPFPPVEPPPGEWAMGRLRPTEDEDLVAAGADLSPGTLLAAYRVGLFPMGLGDHGARPIGWWSPEPRGVLVPANFRESRSLRKARSRFEVRVDTAFPDVMRLCGDPERVGRWITDEIVTAYTEMHRLGWAHSVETWLDGRLVGGLYGIAVGGLFAGESMFHLERDASKVALAALVDLVRADGDERRIIDVQWSTGHLERLGVVEWPRRRYLEALAVALEAPDLRFC